MRKENMWKSEDILPALLLYLRHVVYKAQTQGFRPGDRL